MCPGMTTKPANQSGPPQEGTNLHKSHCDKLDVIKDTTPNGYLGAETHLPHRAIVIFA
jgi:hypothetical protein